MRSLARMRVALVAMALVFAITPMSRAANIITFDDNAQSCAGSVMCSTNGTTGYLNNGTGVAFDLSTINSWFQIDPNGVNLLATQTKAEPDKDAGGFRVVNDTGHIVTSFSLTLVDTFTSSTQSVTFCSGKSGPLCDNFQIHIGTGAPKGASANLSGPGFKACTQTSGSNCVAANFTPGTVTYTWSGLDIPSCNPSVHGSCGSANYFDISFSSWNNGASPVPEPSSLVLLGSGLIGMGTLFRRKTRR